ncbi:MAG: DUF2117 domain-containing protein, partial [Candidatus Methanoperedens sp.]|nr:DUF2117 domain-containing protein [Candidatus Methanoperedens sp.]
IVDTGSAKRIIDIFKHEHEVIAKLGGTMGRTAVLDAGLEDLIDITMGRTPSETINDLDGRIDLAILLNQGKTLETGRYFGRIVASKIDRSDNVHFVHIESPDAGGRIIYYDPGAKPCAEYVKTILATHDEKYDLPVEIDLPNPSNIRPEGDGLEKLEEKIIDLYTAKVKTGNIRRSQHKPKIKDLQSGTQGKITIIDHCAEFTFELMKDAGLVITVGDDTTAIAADILTRFGIPIIGITDGDLDSVLENTAVPAGSVIIRVKEGKDDIVGREVFEKLLGCRQRIQIPEAGDFLARLIALAEKDTLEIKYY